jgi:hypothetical protein
LYEIAVLSRRITTKIPFVWHSCVTLQDNHKNPLCMKSRCYVRGEPQKSPLYEIAVMQRITTKNPLCMKLWCYVGGEPQISPLYEVAVTSEDNHKNPLWLKLLCYFDPLIQCCGYWSSLVKCEWDCDSSHFHKWLLDHCVNFMMWVNITSAKLGF